MKRALVIAVTAAAVALAFAQVAQPERSNPPVAPGASFAEVVKPPAVVESAVNRACRDCHSHETVWPWYSRIAPVSWMVARDVREGRARLNLSQWNVYGPEMSKMRIRAMCREVTTGEMAPAYYRPLHRGARLTQAEMSAICALGS